MGKDGTAMGRNVSATDSGEAHAVAALSRASVDAGCCVVKLSLHPPSGDSAVKLPCEILPG